jgi:hypothetical protein
VPETSIAPAGDCAKSNVSNAMTSTSPFRLMTVTVAAGKARLNTERTVAAVSLAH